MGGERELTHVDAEGRARMVDVGDKPVTRRVARARAVVEMQPETLAAIRAGNVKKGAVLATARLAGVMAAKRTDSLIPLCHSLPIDSVDVDFTELDDSRLEVVAEARVTGKTGVEMEAMVAAGIASLTIYDMCKAIDRGMVVSEVMLMHKSGGKSGTYDRPVSE